MFEKYLRFIEKANPVANAMWNKVNFIQVAEVINHEIDLRALDKECFELDKKVSDIKYQLNLEMDALPEETFDRVSREYDQVESLLYKINDKLSAIETVISALRDIEDKLGEDNFGDLFNDSTKINIDESFSFIKLERFKK